VAGRSVGFSNALVSFFGSSGFLAVEGLSVLAGAALTGSSFFGSTFFAAFSAGA